MTPNRDARIVVTGIGATTPLGGTAPETWDALLAGRSGARALPAEWLEQFELPVTFAASIAQDPAEVLTKVETRRMDRTAQYALIAGREAWADAGSPEVEPERLAVAFGTGIGGVTTLLDQWDVMREKGPRRVYPLTVPMLMPNTSAGNLSLEFGARAGAHTTVSACASGAEAMGLAIDIIRSGRADVVIAGGTEAPMHPLPFAGFAAMKALSTRNDDPQAASRPYDTGRDGFVMGEGAGVLVLEELEHAKKRGAKIYGEVIGYGMSGDAHHITAPAEGHDGAYRAMKACLRSARMTPGDIQYINAHGTSTPMGDDLELEAVERMWGDAADRVAMSSTKSAIGHLLGAAGALEAVFAAQAVLPDMKATGRGAIVNLGSCSWVIGQGGMAAYTASKSAVLGLTRSLARDFEYTVMVG